MFERKRAPDAQLLRIALLYRRSMKMNSLFCNGRPIRQRLPVLSALLSTALLSAFAFSGSLCRCAEPELNETVGLDARHVRTEVPTRLLTDQVFEAGVTMKNSGSAAWSDGLKLSSLSHKPDRMGPETKWNTHNDFLGTGEHEGVVNKPNSRLDIGDA